MGFKITPTKKRRSTIKAWITKYALTKGIYQEIGSIKSTVGPDYFSVIDRFQIFTQGEYFESKQDAIENSEQRRVKKLASLKKQMDKIGKIEFK